MGDAAIRAAAQPVPELGPAPFSPPPALDRARVAIVTTAARRYTRPDAAPPRGESSFYEQTLTGTALRRAQAALEAVGEPEAVWRFLVRSTQSSLGGSGGPSHDKVGGR